MQFKHPEVLYALLLLLIPIIIHLFQLRRFQKVPFTNVEFLKKVDMQTRKSQQLKKWLTLITRLLLLAAVILAFAQPFTSPENSTNLETETVIYLDNSFSMQAKGNKGELLKRAVQDIISSMDENERISLFTNNQTFKQTTTKAIRNELLQLSYSSNQLDYNAAILKGNQLFDNRSNTIKNFILISDFQQNKPINAVGTDSLIRRYFIQLEPVNTNNVGIDSAYIANQTIENVELHVLLNQLNEETASLPISLYNNDELVTKTAVNSNNRNVAIFTLQNNTNYNGRLTIEDNALQFDNSLYFNINERPKINVLSINESDDNHLRRVYTDDEFNFNGVASDQLNYNDIEKQDLIVLNQLKTVPLALINALSAFNSRNSNIIIIPSNEIDLSSYNQLFNGLNSISFGSLSEDERQVTAINYSHPIYTNVFDQEVSNFQYPKVNSYYTASSTPNQLLNFEDGSPFLIQSENCFIFTAAIGYENSNFINSPLIVPTLYNIGRQSFKLPELYYTIGKENTYDIQTSIQQDDILKLSGSAIEIIPQQRTYSDKVEITTNDLPNVSGIYEVTNKSNSIDFVSYNYNRNESELNYHNLTTIEGITIGNSVPNILNDIKSATNINALWKWFVIFALIFLIIEMLILRFFK